jgi:hypothetical protein
MSCVKADADAVAATVVAEVLDRERKLNSQLRAGDGSVIDPVSLLEANISSTLLIVYAQGRTDGP